MQFIKLVGMFYCVIFLSVTVNLALSSPDIDQAAFAWFSGFGVFILCGFIIESVMK